VHRVRAPGATARAARSPTRGAALVLALGVLAGLGSAVGLGARSARAAAGAADGEELFLMACATCHLGGGGLLGGPRTPDLFVDVLPRGEDEASLRQTIVLGIDPPRMPSFAQGLAEDEIDAIVSYLLARRAASASATDR
jgi:mono/diheme cytochrome c family protein